MEEPSNIKEVASDHYFRCLHSNGRWVLEVGLVVWGSPHQPSLRWKPFRSWKKEPSAERLLAACTAATKRYFRTCTRCGTLCNLGHMHDRSTCQSCAVRFLRVVY